MEFGSIIANFFAGLEALRQHPEKLLPSLQYITAFAIAMGFFALRRRTKGRKLRLRVLLRAMFRKSQWLNRSTFIDVCYLLANAFVFGGLFIIVTQVTLSVYEHTHQLLVSLGGEPALTTLSSTSITAILMAAGFIGYEFGYFIDHYLSHKVRFLWEFHKIHHSATSLTPFTNSRVHPVDTAVFFCIIGVTMGGLQGMTGYLLGTPVSAIAFSQNFFLLAYFYLYAHLQHSHVWLPFTGVAGHIFCSPAHHQIHHSMKPKHFDKNFGSSLVVFDWLFGTLYIPSKEREVTATGVNNDGHLHSFVPSLIVPFALAAKHLLPKQVRKAFRRSH